MKVSHGFTLEKKTKKILRTDKGGQKGYKKE